MTRAARCFSVAILLLLLGAGQSLAAIAGVQVGDFLVAEENIRDPRFREGVILLLQHDPDGSAGLIVNRTSRLPLVKVLPAESLLRKRGGALSYGGPVEPEGLLALVWSSQPPPEPADAVLENLYITGAPVLEDWLDAPEPFPAFRVFAGYAGWEPGQLNGELGRGDWRVLPGAAAQVFREDLGGMWTELINRHKRPLEPSASK